MAVPFDARRLEAGATPRPIVEHVGGSFDVSATGALVYSDQTGVSSRAVM